MSKILSLAWLLTIVFGSGTAFAACGGRIHILDNQTVTRVMTLRGGKQCNIRLTNSRGPTHGVVIVERPAHGKAFVRDPHLVTYVAGGGFVGRDSFSYARHGLDTRNNPVRQTVRVAVRIVR